ncbi:MAG: hypothetical protein LLF75_05695 [Eubacteriales bacterium]|nr:hypothetical protein [Eubacteriales bacterium]
MKAPLPGRMAGRTGAETETQRRMTLDVTELALHAAQDDRAREELIRRQERNILRIASRAKHRFVSKSDDEWSIALCAFSHAIDTFDRSKGGFLSYAETLIRRALIDAYRAETKFAREIAVAPEAFDGEAEETTQSAVLFAVVESSVRAADTRLRDEILAANEALGAYGFRFYELTSSSPRQAKTRKACARAVRALLSRPADLEQLTRTKQLPMKNLIRQDGISKKLLDQYRRYIIASVVLQTGEFPILTGYIRGCGLGEEE